MWRTRAGQMQSSDKTDSGGGLRSSAAMWVNSTPATEGDEGAGP